MPGQGVDFTVTSGGGGVSLASVETGSDGRASVTWTLGASAGAQAVQAKVVGAGVPDDLTFDFSATAVAGSGSPIAAVSGDDQSAPVNSSLPDSLVVRVSDGNGNPVSGISITWSVQGGGSISPETVVTDDDGRAAAQRVLGSAADSRPHRPRATGSPIARHLRADGGGFQPDRAHARVGRRARRAGGLRARGDLVVKLTDADGNGVGGLGVVWVVATGGGTANPANSTTDPGGVARRDGRSAPSPGPIPSPPLSGLPPVPFTATGSSDAPTTIALVSGNNQTAVGGARAAPAAGRQGDGRQQESRARCVGRVDGRRRRHGLRRNVGDEQPGARADHPDAGHDAGSLHHDGGGSCPRRIAGDVHEHGVGWGGGEDRDRDAAVWARPPTERSSATQPVVQVQDAGGNNVGPAGRAINASILTPPMV